MKYRKTKCASCRGPIEYPIEGAGQTVDCPHCSQSIQLPSRDWVRRIVWGSLALLLALLLIPSVVTYFEWANDPSPIAQQRAQVMRQLFGNAAVGLLILVCLIASYFLPSIVAAARRHRNTVGICLINFFLGWTILGWLAALVWACYVEKPEPRSSP